MVQEKNLNCNAVTAETSRTRVTLFEKKQPDICTLALTRNQMQASPKETCNFERSSFAQSKVILGE